MLLCILLRAIKVQILYVGIGLLSVVFPVFPVGFGGVHDQIQQRVFIARWIIVFAVLPDAVAPGKIQTVGVWQSNYLWVDLDQGHSQQRQISLAGFEVKTGRYPHFGPCDC